MADPAFWNDQAAAQTVINEANRLKSAVNPIKSFRSETDDLVALLELVDESADDPDAQVYQQEIVDTLARLKPELDKLELASFLSGPNDNCNALLTINSGAGGTESCDWADMLLRMYTRWAEQAGFNVEVLDITPGEEAGISSAMLRTLKSRLYEKQEDEKRSEMEKFYSEKGDIAWGNQIRSYVFQPYQMVKDLRTGVESGNVQAVMDGALDPFVHAWLRAGGPTSRRSAAEREFGDE